jgi:hypothetical protein
MVRCVRRHGVIDPPVGHLPCGGVSLSEWVLLAVLLIQACHYVQLVYDHLLA